MRNKPSIIRRLLLLSVTVAMIPVMTSIFYFQSVISIHLKDQAQKSVDGVAGQIGQTIQTHMTALNNISYYLMANDLAQLVMNHRDSPATAASLEKQIDTMMTYNDAWSSRFIQSLFLLREDGAAFATTREGLYAGVRERNLRVAKARPQFTSTRALLRPEGSAYCYYLQDYYQIDIQKKLGKLIIEVDPNRLFGEDPLQSLPEGSSIFLLGQEGQVLHALGAFDAAGSLDEAWQAAPKKAEEGIYRVRQPLGRYRMQLELLVSHEAILRPVTASRTAYIWVQAAVFALMIGLILLIASRMRPHSRQLLSQMERLAQGDFSVSLPPSRFREYDITSRAFNQTTKQLGTLFEKEKETSALLAQAEFQSLESQISPHFIMNVLETINMRCLLEGQEDTAALVVSLGNLLSSNVRNKKRQQIPLKDELEYVRYYLALQQARFAHLNSSIEVEDEALYQCLLPKLTLQPLVENCFVHGLEDSSAKGYISIRCWEEDGQLMLQVKDNGKGFDVKQWQEETGGREAGSKKNSGIALKNIRRRIELLYGKNYGFEIDSAPGKGTAVWLTLPMIAEKEGETKDA